jgi:hypothetical protein
MSLLKKQRLGLEDIAVADASLDPLEFFSGYVSTRKPLKFNNLIRDEAWKGEQWTNKVFREKSGDAILRVEHRSGPLEPFGCGKEEKISFGSFLDSLEQEHETSYYLTTQELSYTHEGQPSLTSPPIDGLIGQFPWVPKLCGNHNLFSLRLRQLVNVPLFC